ncbi:YybH family protein [Schlesneria paludicola]|uniref:YybH family protein n=1 Tax=Schlesneria paludicola TaxID=360056 RepID=UPI00029AD7A6|nr:SgcJ/EcaC family oxidoreductase [Schlesneria paludicola]
MSTILFSVALLAHDAASAQDTKTKIPTKAVPVLPSKATPSTPAAKTAKPDSVETVQTTVLATTATADDENAVRAAAQAYIKLFNEGNAKGLADHYTTNAEYIDERGVLVRGRTAIEESLKTYLSEHPGCTLDLNIASIRIVGAGMAIEDGTATLTLSNGAAPTISRYTAVSQKTGARWQLASVRDFSTNQPPAHRDYLKQLDWMLGEWVHEGSDAVVVFNCHPSDNGNFLVRNFTIRISGQDAISGSQRIGWDAQAKKFRAWTFDSDGGHSDGYWHRDGDSWVLKAAGVTATGQSASNTSIYTFTNPHTITFQVVDHEIAGEEFPDSPKVKIVRHPPRPE